MSSTTILQRLRMAGLRLTIARIGVLQVIETSGETSISAEDVFRQMMRRGTPSSIGTVYRVIHQFEAAGLLLREWGAKRTALYRLKPEGFDDRVLRLLCRACGRDMAVADTDLHEQLERVARQQGLRLGNHPVTIELTCAGCIPPGLSHCPARACGRSRGMHQRLNML